MSSLTESTEDKLPGSPAIAWTLTLAHHPDASLVGRRIEIARDALRLGRDSEVFGPAALSAKAVSRSHAQVQLGQDGHPLLQDLSSKNGTFLNGHRVQEAVLQTGDVIGMGDRLLLVGATAADRVVPAIGCVGDGPQGSSIAIALARESAARLARGMNPVVVVGECGSGKNVFAHYIHSLSQRSPLVVLHPGAFVDASAPEALFGTGESGLLTKARGGTLLLDDLELAGPKLQAALLRFLDSGEIPAVPDVVDVRMIVTAEAGLDILVQRGIVSAALAGRLGMSVLEVPSLRTRQEDIPLLFRAALADAGVGDGVRIDARLMLAVLRCPWPGNVRELRAFARQVAASSADGADLIELTPEHLRSLRAAPDMFATSFAASASELLVAQDGSWFATAGERIDLSRRPHLARLLAALVRSYEGDGADSSVSVTTLFRAGWPDERVARGSASARVYVAIGTLRKLGLRQHLESDAGGYRLSARPRPRIVAPGRSAAL